MTTEDNKKLETSKPTEAKRKRTSIRDAVGNRGPLWLPQDILPGYRLYWCGVTQGNPYKLYQMLEIGYGPLTEEQKRKVFGLIPQGLITQTQTEMGSWITKQSGSTTHYLVCIPLEDAEDITREKRELRKERDAARMQDIKNNPILTSSDLSVRGNNVKTWE